MSYDLDGNLLNDGAHAYSWNVRNQLAAIDSGSTASFVYGPFGRRVSKTVYGVNTGYLYDGANVVQELAGSNPSANLLTGGLDEVFTRTDSNGVADFIRDGLGSTAELTDSTGAISQTYTYDPYGATSTSGGSTNSYQYIGREADATGIYYLRARYYNPTIDRFLSEDPAGFAGGENIYAYAYDDPVNFADPSGLKPPPNPFQPNSPGPNNPDPNNPCKDLGQAVKEAQLATLQYAEQQVGLVGVKPDLVKGTISSGYFTVDQQGNVSINPMDPAKYEGSLTAPDIFDPEDLFDLGKSLDDAANQGTTFGERLDDPLKIAAGGCAN